MKNHVPFKVQVKGDSYTSENGLAIMGFEGEVLSRLIRKGLKEIVSEGKENFELTVDGKLLDPIVEGKEVTLYCDKGVLLGCFDVIARMCSPEELEILISGFEKNLMKVGGKRVDVSGFKDAHDLFKKVAKERNVASGDDK